MVTRLHSDANETEIRVCIAGDRDRRVGGCANEGEPRVKITPVGGYVTYVGDGSLHEHWKRANFVPGGNFHRANTHTHAHAHTKQRNIPLYGYMPLCAEEVEFSWPLGSRFF